MSDEPAPVLWLTQAGAADGGSGVEPPASACERPVEAVSVHDGEDAVETVVDREPAAVVYEGPDVDALLVGIRVDLPELPVVAVGDPATRPIALSDRNADAVRPGDGTTEEVLARLDALGPEPPAPDVDPEESLVRYETILDTIGDGVYALDEDYRYLFVNDAMTDITGYERDELVDAPATIVLSGDDLSTGVDARGRALADPESVQRIELDVDRADGASVPVENRFAAVFDDGQFLGTVGVVRDITERRRREAELRHKTESLEAFASLVSHDLRNPLTVASGYLDDLAERAEDPAIEEIRTSHDRMGEIIDDLLLLARDEDDVEVEAVDLADIVRDAWSEVPTAEATLAVETDARIEAAPAHLKHLLENLFRNAVDHCGDDVHVTVGDLDGGFAVADDGPGFPAALQGVAFERGVSGDDGTGLGLSIVRAVADAHGWTVTAEAGEDGGAMVCVRGVAAPTF